MLQNEQHKICYCKAFLALQTFCKANIPTYLHLSILLIFHICRIVVALYLDMSKYLWAILGLILNHHVSGGKYWILKWDYHQPFILSIISEKASRNLEWWCNFPYCVFRYLSLARPTGKQTNLAGQTVIGQICGAWRVLGCDWWWWESHLS